MNELQLEESTKKRKLRRKAAVFGAAVFALVLLVIGGFVTFQSLSEEGRGSKWSAWSAYTECSVSCGEGRKTKTRTCQSSHYSCTGRSTHTIYCNGGECPATVWGEWSDYSACSVSCGIGFRSRTASCVHHCREHPVEEVFDFISCFEEYCPDQVPTWSEWVESECQQTCGPGIKTRTRDCADDCHLASDADRYQLEVLECIKEECTGIEMLGMPVIQPISNQTVMEGEDVTFVCTVWERRSHLVMWGRYSSEHPRHIADIIVHDGVVLDDNNDRLETGLSGSADWFLRIKKATVADEGLYMCEVDSPIRVQEKFHLEVVPKEGVLESNATYTK